MSQLSSRSYRNRPLIISLLASLLALDGVLSLIAVPLFPAPGSMTIYPGILGTTIVVLGGLIVLLLSWGIWMLRDWAYWLVAAFTLFIAFQNGLALLSGTLNIAVALQFAFAVIVLVILSNRTVRKVFHVKRGEIV